MEAIEIGEVELIPIENRRMMLWIDEQQDSAYWSVEEVRQAVEYLQAWIQEQEHG